LEHLELKEAPYLTLLQKLETSLEKKEIS